MLVGCSTNHCNISLFNTLLQIYHCVNPLSCLNCATYVDCHRFVGHVLPQSASLTLPMATALMEAAVNSYANRFPCKGGLMCEE